MSLSPIASRALNGAKAPLLLLDYDGTLADFRINRFDARPWAGVRELLSVIQKDNRTRLTIITGRPAGEINSMLSLPKPVEVWGLHGAERLFADGRHEMQEAPPEALAKLDELREQLRRNAFGGLFEDKPNAVVMHWRGHPARQARHIEQKTRTLFEPAAQLSGLSLLDPSAAAAMLKVTGKSKSTTYLSVRAKSCIIGLCGSGMLVVLATRPSPPMTTCWT